MSVGENNLGLNIRGKISFYYENETHLKNILPIPNSVEMWKSGGRQEQ